MVRAIIHHRVKDFDRWLPAFREHAPTRRQYGCGRTEVRRSISDPNDVVVEMEWSDEDRFSEFVERSDLRDVMARAGVVGEPEITLVSDPVPWER